MKRTLKTIAEAYLRERHRRGFGVHSPFAFRIINDIVRNHADYYAFDEITTLVPDGARYGHRLKEAIILFRLVARMAPKALMPYPGCPDYLRNIVQLADSRTCLLSPSLPGEDLPGETVAVIYDGNLPQNLKELLVPDGRMLYAFGLTEPQVTKIRETMTSGLVLYNCHSVLAFSRHGMQKVEYSCRF